MAILVSFMKSLRRYHMKDAQYFLTVVTYRREKLLLLEPQLFWDCWDGFILDAWVVLGDHFHIILAIGGKDISKTVHGFKIKYSRHFRDKHRPGRVWQNRFWDHIIRDQDDLERHLDYIHFNPVKHGVTDDPFEYEHSSLSSYFQEGCYGRDWGVNEELTFEGEYGE